MKKLILSISFALLASAAFEHPHVPITLARIRTSQVQDRHCPAHQAGTTQAAPEPSVSYPRVSVRACGFD